MDAACAEVGQASLTYLGLAAVLDLAQLVEVVAWWTLPNL